MFAWNYDSPTRGWGGDKKPFGAFDGCIGGWDIDGEPYTVGRGRLALVPRRARSAAARTTGAASRCGSGPTTSNTRAIDGLGDDWPITYDDIKPYYDKLDEFVGIFGTNHAAETGLHNEPDGIFLPPPKPRAHELLIKKACDRLKIPVVPSRLSILTRPHNGRAACHYCGQCGRGCAMHSNFSSTSVMLPPALKTGKLTIVPNAMAREVTTGADGLATGVSYIDTQQMTEHQVRARVVVLAASCCESARLLLNSKSSRFPNGLANSSGRGRQVPDRLDGPERQRVHSRAAGPAALQRGRRRRHAPVRAVVGRQQGARLSARLSHRARRRLRHAGVRLHGRHPGLPAKPRRRIRRRV